MTTAPQPMTVSIDAIADQGDGVASGGGRPVFVPFTVPGDEVEIAPAGPAGHARATVWRRRGPRRQDPPCPHFGRCGGCALQHLEPAFYREWKMARIAAALGRRGLQTPVIRAIAIAPLAETPPGARRRVELAARRYGRTVALGFHERLARAIVPVERCPVMLPSLAALLPALRGLLATLLPDRGSADLMLTATDSGVDLLITGLSAAGHGRRDELALRERLAGFAADHDLARIALAARRGAAEVIAARRPPRVMFGDVAVDLPPGGFLQASREGELAIRGAVTAALDAAGLRDGARIADLFAGCGTLSLPLARRAQVRAVEGDRAMAAALESAARRAGLGARVVVEVRDLARRPLRADELSGLDAVVFDPPRDGAAAQAAELARAAVPLAIGVSCNPATFARDAAVLLGGGWRLLRVAPVDQFLWSPHLELVGVFVRG